MEKILFFLFSGLAIVSGVWMITRRNPVGSLVSLVWCLLFLAGLFALLSAHFVAITQVLLYAGAILVLFLFAIMLLGLKPQAKQKLLKFQLPLSILLAVILLVQVAFISFSVKAQDGITGTPGKIGSIEELGRFLFTDYMFPFEVISLFLLVAIVGAIILAKREV